MTNDDHASVIENEAFVATYMYVGRGSRRPWIALAATLVFSAAFMFGSFWLYNDLAAWEEAGSPERWENVFVVWMYELGGKELVRNVGLGFSALFAVTGVASYFKSRAVRRESLRPSPERR